VRSETVKAQRRNLGALIIEDFLPRFAGGARVLCQSAAAGQQAVADHAQLQALGFPASDHDKLPDFVAWIPDRNWLFLIEVGGHGAVTAQRKVELEELMGGCAAGKVYVSAFLSFAEFKRHADQIAWDTEVWIAEAPGHLVHYGGDRFYGPR
jgi:type II restriction enzyme